MLTTTIELQGSLQSDAFLGTAGFGVSFLCSVQSIDISLMVLRVMEQHDLMRYEGLESIVRVRQWGESVRHVNKNKGDER